jgi:hypothetical protein
LLWGHEPEPDQSSVQYLYNAYGQLEDKPYKGMALHRLIKEALVPFAIGCAETYYSHQTLTNISIQSLAKTIYHSLTIHKELPLGDPDNWPAVFQTQRRSMSFTYQAIA